jgi:hypothetical protein
MPLMGFKPETPACEWLQTHTLDQAANGIGNVYHMAFQIPNSTYMTTALFN